FRGVGFVAALGAGGGGASGPQVELTLTLTHPAWADVGGRCGLGECAVDAVLVVLGPVEEREGGGGGAGGPVAVALCYVVEQSGHGGRGGLPVVGFFEEVEGEHPCLVFDFGHEVGDVEVDGCGVGFWCAWHSGVCVAS